MLAAFFYLLKKKKSLIKCSIFQAIKKTVGLTCLFASEIDLRVLATGEGEASVVRLQYVYPGSYPFATTWWR